MKIDLNKFQIPSIDSWKNQVWKEANSDKALIYTNPIENIRIDIYLQRIIKRYLLLLLLKVTGMFVLLLKSMILLRIMK